MRVGFIKPLEPGLATVAPEGDAGLHEIKYDGFRTQLVIDGGNVRTFTRRGYDWTERYPGIVAAGADLGVASAVIDGEAIVQDEQGRSDFHRFNEALAARSQALVLMSFDLLHLNGRDMRSLPLIERRSALSDLVADADPVCRIQFSDHVLGNGPAMLEAADKMGLEGIVSKKVSSRYRSGPSRSWLKVKCFGEEEFVVVGTSRGERAPIAWLARETSAGLELAGPAMVTLAALERDQFWRANERLKTGTPALPMEPRKETSWLRPEIRVRAQFLKGEETLRHATVKSIVSIAPERTTRMRKLAQSEPSYPKPDFDQAALADYYEAIGELMLPWVAARPLNLFRCTGGRCFFQRNRNHPATDQSFPEPIHSLPVLQKNGKTEAYLFVDDVPGILACVEADTVEFHGWGSLVSDIERPNRMALDLDPDPDLDFDEVKSAATDLRRHLHAIGLTSWPLLTGGKGIHVVVPLTPAAEWDEVREFARRFCTLLAEAEPERFTVQIAKAKRRGRIFLDYLRNQRTATAIMPYSARGRAGLPVAAPVAWDELVSLRSADVFRTTDVKELRKRARSKTLRLWGCATQRLPML